MSNSNNKYREVYVQLELFKSRASTVENIKKAFKYVEDNLIGIKIAGTGMVRQEYLTVKHDDKIICKIPYFDRDIYKIPDNDPDNNNKQKIKKLKLLEMHAVKSYIHKKFNYSNYNYIDGYITKQINNKGTYGEYTILPDITDIRQEGISSAGLINLMRLSVGLKLPNHSLSPNENYLKGSGEYWFKYFTKNNLFQSHSTSYNYPHGTLFMSCVEPYHMAILYRKKKSPFELLHSKILHAYIDENHPNKGQVGDTIFLYTNMIDRNENSKDKQQSYFKFVVLPDDWLSTNKNDTTMVSCGINIIDKYDKKFKLLNYLKSVSRRTNNNTMYNRIYNRIYNNSIPTNNIIDHIDNDIENDIIKLNKLLCKTSNSIMEEYLNKPLLSREIIGIQKKILESTIHNKYDIEIDSSLGDILLKIIKHIKLQKININSDINNSDINNCDTDKLNTNNSFDDYMCGKLKLDNGNDDDDDSL